MIRNPILPGFNPDPSICRAGEDYFIATSTFEWVPGVQIHHSRDLVHWRLRSRPLTRYTQLDLRGEPASAGVWAPCLTHDGHRFHLVYSDMKSTRGRYWDVDNYLVTAPSIDGPWSDPVYLNGSGFDPSLFHDTDGRKWLLNMLQDPREGRNRFAGIVLQEFDPAAGRLIGAARRIFEGSSLGTAEGPHLYRRNGEYYLMVAEGGTGYRHAVTMARARHIEGPYTIDPQNPLLTSHNTTAALQKAGHGSWVETPTGEHYLAHLCGRPIVNERGRFCILGRETALQKVVWTSDGWLRLADGGTIPRTEVPAPALPPHPFSPEPESDDFDAPGLNPHFQTRREFVDDRWLSLRERPGFLRLRGRKSPFCAYAQSLIGRRIQAFRCAAETVLEFDPPSPLQSAGLLAYYNEDAFCWLNVSHDEILGKCVALLTVDQGQRACPLAPVSVAGWTRVWLKAVLDGAALQFWYGPDGVAWTPAGPVLDATRLSDEAGGMRFTGAFFALNCVDAAGTFHPADFDRFTYREP